MYSREVIKLVKRIATGIKGFDALVEGGIPEGASVLLSGTPGTGKTIFCLQVAYNNSLKGNKSLHITFEQTEKDIKEQMRQFGWTKLNGNLKIVSLLSEDFGIVDTIISKIKKEKPNLVTIDSVASLFGSAPKKTKELGFDEIEETVYPFVVDQSTITRSTIKAIINGIRKLGVTSILISEIIKDSPGYSRDTISEFLCDWVVVLHSVEGEEGFRTLHIPKTRLTKQKSGIYSFEMGKKGIIVKSGD